jgi:hypothetical protein
MSSPLVEQAVRQKLQQVRNTILTLHKALLDSDRTAYEILHGRIGSPGAFLQLLINDPWFAWLQPMTTLIVQIDEALAAKPPSDAQVLEQMLTDTRSLLLAPADVENTFWKRYSAAVQRDPAVGLLQQQLQNELGD